MSCDRRGLVLTMIRRTPLKASEQRQRSDESEDERPSGVQRPLSVRKEQPPRYVTPDVVSVAAADPSSSSKASGGDPRFADDHQWRKMQQETPAGRQQDTPAGRRVRMKSSPRGS